MIFLKFFFFKNSINCCFSHWKEPICLYFSCLILLAKLYSICLVHLFCSLILFFDFWFFCWSYCRIKYRFVEISKMKNIIKFIYNAITFLEKAFVWMGQMHVTEANRSNSKAVKTFIAKLSPSFKSSLAWRLS